MTATKTKSNRANARKSTGPKSSAGKAIVALNGVVHGLRAVTPVVDGLESVAEWESHRAALLDSFAPVGGVETLLAERVALLAWRLGRVATYERDRIGMRQENITAEVRAKRRDKFLNSTPHPELTPLEHPEDVLAFASDSRALVRDLERLPALADSVSFSESEALNIIYRAERTANKMQTARPIDLLDGEDARLLEVSEWTAGKIRAVIQSIVSLTGLDAAAFFAQLDSDAAVQKIVHEGDETEVCTDVSRRRREYALPDTMTLEKIQRYEAHLERAMFRTLHELERIQAARMGRNVPLPAVLDVTVSAPEAANLGAMIPANSN